MKRNLWPAVLIILLLLQAQFGSGDEKKKADPPAPNFFPLQTGNEWHFQTTANGKEVMVTMRVAKIETIERRKLARLETSLNGDVIATEHLQQTDKGIFRYRFNGAEITPPVAILKYPTKAGEKWTGEFGTAGQKAKYSCETAEEQVEVPAGKFKTVRVAIKAEEKGQPVRTTYWFANEVGIVKQSFTIGDVDVVFELKRHTKAK